SSLWRTPFCENVFERLLLGLVHNLATLPCYGLDQLDDCSLDTIAQVVGVHGVKLPTTIAVAGAEPFETRVFALIGCRKRRQSAYVFAGESDAPQRYVIAVVFGEPFG